MDIFAVISKTVWFLSEMARINIFFSQFSQCCESSEFLERLEGWIYVKAFFLIICVVHNCKLTFFPAFVRNKRIFRKNELSPALLQAFKNVSIQDQSKNFVSRLYFNFDHCQFWILSNEDSLERLNESLIVMLW